MSALTSEQAAQLLYRAEQVVSERGWCQNDFVDGTTGAVCAVAAIHVAFCGSPWDFDLDDDQYHWAEELRDLLDVELGESVINWNDVEGRLSIEVKALMHRVAERLERAAGAR